ncbi:putative deoxynucleotide monophosphate kinase [Cupriavidus necator]|uniref:Putative deoxynucleotide monophosphate kinase n=1 Tax=Cupriavidus necator TaxID=106590 RepID=A0A1K0I8G9_CUPNE|nr:putative deoxynucleotide monophosphate kinase [Cupriavidus necator]
MLIGLTGRAGSGKDTAAAYLAEAHRFMPLAFATPIRHMLQAGLGLTDEHFTPAAKNVAIDWLGRSPRQLMQTLGTEWGRTHIGSTVWVDVAERELDSLSGLDVVFTDVRFENEAAMIRNRGGIIIRLVRAAAQPVHSHVSEAGIKLLEFDREIHNNGTLFELYDRLDAVVGEEAFLGALS